MRIINFNANGIRSAARKGFFEWLEHQSADVVCIQETKAQIHQLDDEIFHPRGYECFYFDAQKKGYSGVALYSKKSPEHVIMGMGIEEFDTEGRYLEARYGGLSVISVYLPSGSSGDHRQEVKWRFLDAFMPELQKRHSDGRQYVYCGDWNIAHKPIDLRNWRSNQKNSGFLPEERAWLDRLYDEVGWVDTFRAVNPNPDEYTWWSNRGQARANNVGWRLDYQIATPLLSSSVRQASVHRDDHFSDHAPVIMDYDWPF
ncbi:exodeoxyribonuclease-3 [Ectothiorhodosinus mongolicus]|uniref:Exodeoxyribonuclease-3 n=1 Tax=Ectothiorhodosinus mongolicus TaxID=233100 RepID=A0A1R3VYN1_9GAMM|nr:exodeoxyribonuclease III [Ectothiorhodosinus mongolicus]ULX56944.1 exodeoxyribonuclease III [Ectothiorhodosinus mongolicus]SIT69115.1 exodeoxyribonuclease-3 [Ectothiorhodosinus mongolicus]